MSGLALVLGAAQEPLVAAVVRELEALRLPFAHVDEHALLGGDVRLRVHDGAVTGVLQTADATVPLDEVVGVYTRLAFWSAASGTPLDAVDLAHAQRVHGHLDAWLELTGARVVNRTSANDSNNSKPYQALLIRDHFDVPATVVTNDPAQVERFRREVGPVVYKSVSGERSIVTRFSDDDVPRLPLLVNGPVQFQEHVAGMDVRVHVVGEHLFATSVTSAAVDYRYDHSGAASMEPCTVPPEVGAECVALTRRLGLELSGIDLRFTDDGRVVCFEVNPSPAFIAYESVTGQPIARAVAQHLYGLTAS